MKEDMNYTGEGFRINEELLSRVIQAKKTRLGIVLPEHKFNFGYEKPKTDLCGTKQYG